MSHNIHYYLPSKTILAFPVWDNHPNPQPADEDFIHAAIASGLGFRDHLTRTDCVTIRAKTGFRLPRWLMKDPARRLERGVYALPELLERSEKPDEAKLNLYNSIVLGRTLVAAGITPAAVASNLGTTSNA